LLSENPLVLRFGALGDTVLLTALLRDLATRWGAPCDVVTGAGPQRRVLAGLDSVRDLFTLPSRRRPYPLAPAQWALVRWLRRRGRPPTWVFDPVPKADWLAARGGIPSTHRLSPREVPRPLGEHTLDYQRRLAAAVPSAWAGSAPPAPAAQAEPELAVPEADRRDCRRWIEESGWGGRPLVLVQSQSRRRNRGRWPTERWAAAVAAVLADLPAARVLLLGSPAEARAVEVLRAACADPRVVNVAAELPLDRLFALATVAHSCLSLDSGPAHVAAALGCPVVVLPGWADPRRNRPPGPPERVRVVAEAPPDEWPPDVYGWQRWHRLEVVPVAAVVQAWRGLAPRRLG
jgi:heptosyltransferase-2/heptosyltransferase-3